MVAGKPQTRCAGPISGAPSGQPDHPGVSFLLLPLHSISMKTATPFPWTGPAAAKNNSTGFRFIEHAPRPAARCNPQGVIIEMNSAFAQALQAGLADQRALHPTTAKLQNRFSIICSIAPATVSAATLQDSTGKETHGAENLQKAGRPAARTGIFRSRHRSIPSGKRAGPIRCSSIWAQRFPFYLYTRAREETQTRAQSSNRFAAKCVKASHPCCSPENWPCPSQECPDLGRKRYEPSTTWPAKCD
jgi:hypothetical protein